MKTVKNLIKITNLNKTYHIGEIAYPALININLAVKPGEMVAIMGPSGSGKSTAMHILGILDSADSGTYELNGTEIKRYSNDRLAEIRNKEIGFVFQAFNLLPRATLAKNVEMPLIYRGIPQAERMRMVDVALQKVGLQDKFDNMPNQISGGQMQRAAIARAIAGSPAIILADEPTGNLDSKTAMEIIRIFQQMNNEGKTIIMITHEQDIAECCKRIITLRDGEIVKDEPNKKFVNLLK